MKQTKNNNNDMNFVDIANQIFAKSVVDYHKTDDVDTPFACSYKPGTIEYDLYLKNWIDTVQWHLEDIIRDPEIDPVAALTLKRRIDKSNQDRTDLVERIDSYFWEQFHNVPPKDHAKINTESPAWTTDRLSILHVKLYHMRAEIARTDASKEHKAKCQQKLDVLEEQLTDLSTSLQQLLDDYAKGEKVMKVYKQMKMYNDPDTNPIFYKKQ